MNRAKEYLDGLVDADVTVIVSSRFFRLIGPDEKVYPAMAEFNEENGLRVAILEYFGLL